MSGSDGQLVLPPAYVARYVELCYAETVHAAQGRTVDYGLFAADQRVPRALAYVAVTRGRCSNEV